MSVFKAYDLRGVYPSELDEDFAYKFGQALALFLEADALVIGRDVRNSSSSLHERFIAGITDQGCDVIDIGICSTPMLYFASQYGAAAMITASHSPKEYNGFKLTRKNAVPIAEDSGLMELKKIFDLGYFPHADKKGNVTQRKIVNDYVAHVADYARGMDKRLKVVLDAGNGAAGVAVEKIAAVIGIDVVPLFLEQDGNFPGRGPNPMLAGKLKPLVKRVKEEGADFGVAYDADCDRVFFVDEKGATIKADLVTALIAEQMLKQHPAASILYDLRSSKAVPERIVELGGTPIITRVGHSFIKEKMREAHAVFAGELSGHYYYATSNYADSGDITFALLACLLSSSGKTLSELVLPLQRYFHSGEINFEVEDKQAVISDLGSRYHDGKHSEIDGITIEYDKWWFNARPSNTQPLLRLVLEAKTQDMMQEKLKEVKSVIGGTLSSQ